MQLENSFTVPVPVDEAWRVLLDIERIAPCMPGAALDSVNGDDFTGRVKVKLGPDQPDLPGQGVVHREGRGRAQGGHRRPRQGPARQRHGGGDVTAKLAAEGSDHPRRRADRPEHHRPAGPVRPRRDDRRRQQAARPVRRQARRPARRGRRAGRRRPRSAAGQGGRRSGRPPRGRGRGGRRLGRAGRRRGRGAP